MKSYPKNRVKIPTLLYEAPLNVGKPTPIFDSADSPLVTSFTSFIL